MKKLFVIGSILVALLMLVGASPVSESIAKSEGIASVSTPEYARWNIRDLSITETFIVASALFIISWEHRMDSSLFRRIEEWEWNQSGIRLGKFFFTAFDFNKEKPKHIKIIPPYVLRVGEGESQKKYEIRGGIFKGQRYWWNNDYGLTYAKTYHLAAFGLPEDLYSLSSKVNSIEETEVTWKELIENGNNLYFVTGGVSVRFHGSLVLEERGACASSKEIVDRIFVVDFGQVSDRADFRWIIGSPVFIGQKDSYRLVGMIVGQSHLGLEVIPISKLLRLFVEFKDGEMKLQEGVEVKYPFLGITYRSTEEGVFVQEVIADSPAEKAGLLTGDTITEINEEKITDDNPFVVLFYKHQAGEEISLTISRQYVEEDKVKFQEMTIIVTLGETEVKLVYK